MKKTIGLTLALSLGLMTSTVALANDTVLGAVIGGGAGALIGHAVGGRNGTLVGGVIGATAGAVIASDQDDNRRHDRRVVQYYAPQPQTVYTTQTYYQPEPAYYPQQQVYYAPPPVRVIAPPTTVYVTSGYRGNDHRYDHRRHHHHPQHPNW